MNAAGIQNGHRQMSSSTSSGQSVSSVPWNAVLACAGVLTLAVTLVASYAMGAAIGSQLTRNTIRLSLAWYAGGLMLMMQLEPHEWNMTTVRGKIARWCWTWGMVSFLVHLAMAFHFYHSWSHAHAFRHTQEVSGVGEGLYASYLFTLLWVADALWWWFSPKRYATRSVWFDRMLHAFMLFIIFNATIVFESGAIRWVSLVVFGALATTWFLSPRILSGGVAELDGSDGYNAA